MLFQMYDSNKVGGRVMIGPTSNLLQFSFFTSLVCFTDDPDWVELSGNEMISSAAIWQIKIYFSASLQFEIFIARPILTNI